MIIFGIHAVITVRGAAIRGNRKLSNNSAAYFHFSTAKYASADGSY